MFFVNYQGHPEIRSSNFRFVDSITVEVTDPTGQVSRKQACSWQGSYHLTFDAAKRDLTAKLRSICRSAENKMKYHKQRLVEAEALKPSDVR